MKRTLKAHRIDVVDFVYKTEFATYKDLMERFGYTKGGASSVLTWIKKLGMITLLTEGEGSGKFTVTDRGVRELIYKGRIK